MVLAGSGSLALSPRSLASASTRSAQTNATYYNNAALPAADPYVLHDTVTHYYYAYSTDGADPGWYFAIYRSADLATWEKLPGGALPLNDPNQWGNDCGTILGVSPGHTTVTLAYQRQLSTGGT